MFVLFQKLHRWIALAFALPLLAVIGSGLVLSLEPSVVIGSAGTVSLTPARIEALLARHDPAGKAKALAYRSYDGSLTIGGGRGAPGLRLDVATGERLARPGALANAFATARQLHERLLIDAGWLVTASTIAMLAIICLGLLLGLPRFANTLSGWHRGTAWVLLPLVILSPLPGLALAFGVTFTAPSERPQGAAQAVTLAQAVRTLGQEHDLSGLIWIRERRGRMLARLVENGEFRVVALSPAGAHPTPRNWPRLLHEGNWAGHVSAALNVLTSLALLGLLVTGVWIWVRRTRRRRQARAHRSLAATQSMSGSG